jgi:hypothetical protein
MVIVTVRGIRLSVEYFGDTVSIRQFDRKDDFMTALRSVKDTVDCFEQSKPGALFGCAGRGLPIERMSGKDIGGMAYLTKSGIGPRKYAQGMLKVQEIEKTLRKLPEKKTTITIIKRDNVMIMIPQRAKFPSKVVKKACLEQPIKVEKVTMRY